MFDVFYKFESCLLIFVWENYCIWNSCFQKFNTINSLVKTEKIHVLFTEEECSKIKSFEMNKNDDDLLHSITLYDTGYNAYKAFIQNQHAFTFKKYSNQIEFISSRHKKNEQNVKNFKNIRRKIIDFLV